MSDIAAFLVVTEKHAHPDTIEATMDAVRQLRGVAGIRTVFNEVGQEVQDIRAMRDELRDELVERAQKAGAV